MFIFHPMVSVQYLLCHVGLTGLMHISLCVTLKVYLSIYLYCAVTEYTHIYRKGAKSMVDNNMTPLL